MKVVSLVPSWTETLLNSNIDVVGRTRFCIYPNSTVPVLGGTKSVKWGRLKHAPDLVLFDKEENTKQMALSCPYPYYSTHIKSIWDVPAELYVLADLLSSKILYRKALLWSELLKTPKSISLNQLHQLKVLKWWRKPASLNSMQLTYLIWKDPFMSVGPNTFISSVFDFLGLSLKKHLSSQDYPCIDLNKMNPKKDLLLFSSEPYPFHKKQIEMLEWGYPCAWVDGECFSWFGDRSFEFLKQV